MNNPNMVWLPNGLPQGLAIALSIVDPGSKIIKRSLYLDLLTQKLDALIEANPKAARNALQMSQENAPGLWAIAEQFPVREWASALVRSDQMTNLLAPLKTEVDGRLANPQPQSLLGILELLA